MRVLGLDVGEKRIGVAKADSNVRIAVPVGFVDVNGTEWQEIARIARMNNTNLFVLGLPRSNEGNETKQSEFAKGFARELVKQVPGAKVRFQDESLTSVVAEERLKGRKKKYEKGEIDAEAASIILQDFLEKIGNNSEKIEKKTKKSKKPLVIITSLIIVAALIAAGVWAVMFIKEKRAEERQAEYRRKEAEMIAETFDFTIVPGETVFDVKKKLIAAGYEETEVEEAMGPKSYDYGFLEGLDSLEGYLFGETHNFYKSDSAKDVIGRFLEGMDAKIKENDLESKYAEQGLSLHEGVILASIVQKEASSPEQPTVAQVFLLRLAYGIPLGSDVTVSYALDIVDPERETYTDNQAALKVDSCYNTRLYGGMPCGAISNPGLSALLAVANPTDTAYLYFLTGDDGMMYYSSTEAEHIQNIRVHCKKLCNVSL